MAADGPLSARNPIVADLRRLNRRRSARHEAGRFVIEGAHVLTEAFDAAVGVELVFVDEGRSNDPEVGALVQRAHEAGARVVVLTSSAAASVSDTVTFGGIGGVAVMPDCCLDDVAAASIESGVPLFALAGTADPGNAGTIIRSTVAARLAGVVFTAGSVDPFNPKVVRASAGLIVHTRIAAVDGEAPVVARSLRECGLRLTGAATSDGVPYDELDWAGPRAIILGNEAHGLTAPLRELVDEMVTIPMPGPAESLNVAMAATLLAFEAVRHRRTRRG